MSEDETGLLAREAASLVARLRLWTAARWAAQADGGSRADVVHHLAQWLADEAGEAPVPLPVLDSPLALPDQLAVTADDLVRTRPAPEQALRAVAHLLAHRRDLLGEDVPASLHARLGGIPVACPGTTKAGPPQETGPRTSWQA